MGAAWRIVSIDKQVIDIFETKPLRGSSYIEMPGNIQMLNVDLLILEMKIMNLFEWCVKYHQSKKDKHDDRTTVLNK